MIENSVAFAPKYKRQVIYGKIKADIGQILRKLCEWKGVEIIEEHRCPTTYTLSISSQIKIAIFMGYEKGKKRFKEIS